MDLTAMLRLVCIRTNVYNNTSTMYIMRGNVLIEVVLMYINGHSKICFLLSINYRETYMCS